jgi:hypothetical protein
MWNITLNNYRGVNNKMETEEEKNIRLNKYAREKVVDRLIANVKAQEIRFQHDWSHAPNTLKNEKDLDEEIGKALNRLRENNIENRKKFEAKYIQQQQQRKKC